MADFQRKTAATMGTVNGGSIEKRDSYFTKKNSKFEPPRQEIVRLHTAGFSLLPLGAGEDGKKPLLGFVDTPHIPLRSVLGALYSKGSQIYAIRLSGLLMVDIDTDTPEAHAYVQEHFGASTVQVKTPRGMHHFFKLPNDTPDPKNVRQNGIAIDFKQGVNSYVAGPTSIRPDGGEYIPVVGVLGETELPEFHPNLQRLDSKHICNNKPSPVLSSLSSNHSAAVDDGVGVGQRNSYLTRKALDFVECVDSESELLAELKAVREYECDDFESILDSELIGIANWAWRLRLENRIFAGRNSGVIMKRNIADILLKLSSGVPAFVLLFILIAAHGHIPGKRFCIDPVAMKKKGLIPFGRNTCIKARDLLIDLGLLRPIGGYKPGRYAQQYQLTRKRRV